MTQTVDFSGRAQWNEYNPGRLGWFNNKWDPLYHPELLVPFTFTNSKGEVLNFGRMHRLVVPIYQEFYTRLDRKHPNVLHPDPDEGCYNPNSKTQNGSRSFHTAGIATDTEWNDNPMGVGVKRHGPGALPNDTDEIGHPLMIQWGGTWTDFKDWMHNEFHGTPQDAMDLTAALKRTAPQENALADTKLTDTQIKQLDAIVRRQLDADHEEIGQVFDAALTRFFGKNFMQSDVNDDGKPDSAKHPLAVITHDEMADVLRQVLDERGLTGPKAN